MALAARKAETEGLLIELFGDPWRPGYDAFAKRINEARKLGLAAVPALALGIKVPGLPDISAVLVARQVIDYRRGIRPKTATEILREMMARGRRRRGR